MDELLQLYLGKEVHLIIVVSDENCFRFRETVHGVRSKGVYPLLSQTNLR